tara:strand:+ start:194 stop:499 length:306 start_codon:yes stop_codon:yes gene_type:complete
MYNKCLYVIQSDVTGAVKIGISSHPQKRLKQLQTGSPYQLKLLCSIANMSHKEKIIHNRLKDYKMSCKGEWFDFSCTGSLPLWLTEAIDWEVANSWWEKNN